MMSDSFSWNLVSDLQSMLAYQFMVHAFQAGTIVAIVAGVVGYFVVLRRSAFAAHALSHIGFAGAAGAVWASEYVSWITPIYGLLLFTTVGGATMAGLGRKSSHRDMSIGITLSFLLGIGVLFISLYTGYATEAYSILFGEILGISASNVILTLVAALALLVVTSFLFRPLLFSSLDQEVAEAKGIPTHLLGVIFMILVAVATSIAVQVVGVLLIFSLMVTPAAVAQQISSRPSRAILAGVLVALVATWLSLFISWYLPYPVSFFITTLTFIAYLFTRYAYPRIRPSSFLHSRAKASEENKEHSHESSQEIPDVS
jgi:zinc/manganese transport system permease protein